MTVLQFFEWCKEHRVTPDTEMIVATFHKNASTIDDVEAIKINSGPACCVQLEIYPDGFLPERSEGTTRFAPSGDVY